MKVGSQDDEGEDTDIDGRVEAKVEHFILTSEVESHRLLAETRTHSNALSKLVAHHY